MPLSEKDVYFGRYDFPKLICPKDVDYAEFYLRHYESSKHFIERIKLRYDIELTIPEYNQLLVEKPFRGLYSKGVNLTIGIVVIKQKKVWALYNKTFRLFTTVFPKEIGTDINETMKACFTNSSRFLANEIYKFIREEINSASMDFKTEKEAALYYFDNYNFPTLLIDKFKHGSIRTIKICHQIKNIMAGTHSKVRMAIIKR